MPIVKPPKATEVKGTETLPQVKLRIPWFLQKPSEQNFFECLKRILRSFLQVNGVKDKGADDEEMEESSATEEVSK